MSAQDVLNSTIGQIIGNHEFPRLMGITPDGAKQVAALRQAGPAGMLPTERKMVTSTPSVPKPSGGLK